MGEESSPSPDRQFTSEFSWCSGRSASRSMSGCRKGSAGQNGRFVMAKGSALLSSLVFVLAVAGAGTTSAEDAGSYPSRPITVVIPTAASVSGDILMRAFGDAVSKHLGQPIVVDNKPGGSGALAAASVANAKPDGYTLLHITTT